MPELYLTPRAEADLREIWLYSFKKWSEEQADRYLHELESGMLRLIDNPQFGKKRDDVRMGYRSLQVNRHIVFYRMMGGQIEIVRILHARMEPQI